MARAARSTGRAGNRRGSPEAIEKRRAARSFNDLLSTLAGNAQALDGRTEKRRQRLLKELADGQTRGARELKPLDILLRVQELLELGESVATIRKATRGKKRPKLEGAEVVDAVKKLHKAYGFRPEVYRFVGIDDDVLAVAGIARAR